jgi:hypothetical protein
MTSRRVLNWAIVIGVVVLTFLISYAGQPGGAATGFEAGRRLGYAFGQALLIGVVVFFVLRFFARRRQGG